MSLLVKSNPGAWGRRSLGAKKLQKIEKAASIEEAVKVTSIERIKDWFCGTDTAELSRLLFILKSKSNKSEFESAKEKVEAFVTLAEHVDFEHEKCLKMTLTQGPLGHHEEHRVSFKIAGFEETFPEVTFTFPKITHMHVEDEEFSQEKDLIKQWCEANHSKIPLERKKNIVGSEAISNWNRSIDEIKNELEIKIQGRLEIHLSGVSDGEREQEIEKFVARVMEASNDTENEELKLNLMARIENRQSIKPWQAYKARKNQKITNEKQPTDKAPDGFVTMTYTSKEDPSVSHSYLIDKKQMLPPIRQPKVNVQPGNVQPKGAFKEVVERDENYIKLKGFRPGIIDTDYLLELTEAEANEQRQAQLEELKSALYGNSFTGTSIAPGLLGVYSGPEGQLLAANGGEDLQKIIFGTQGRGITTKIIPLKAYQQLCKDIAQAHEHSIYFRDIKSANLLYRDTLEGVSGEKIKLENPRVMMIDIDDLVSPTVGQKHRCVGTYYYSTYELLEARLSYETDSPERKSKAEGVLKSADDYALLLCLLEGTSTEIRGIPFTPHDENLPYSGGLNNKANVDSVQQDVIYDAVEQIVLSEDVPKVLNFLSDPIKFPLDKHVLEVIDWNRTERIGQ
ncbi:hypothetical protein D5R81_09670 [Parashewanella spongiae]|uniref:Protein kinase domain-containing protein n=1 Tax=Parashewanella spongiae TaxID=342950 RepID=A0A3A6TQC4_9GAMM|nr:hypothetical protein [Parashewanella spongiae]MCL1078140.1 hypothetical protein [Parashewanella spongiae]RJY16347.1 hypothetical protein D5R81_09670 [Parashewanella spongiae]